MRETDGARRVPVAVGTRAPYPSDWPDPRVVRIGTGARGCGPSHKPFALAVV